MLAVNGYKDRELTYKTIKSTTSYYHSGRQGYFLEYPNQARSQVFRGFDAMRDGLAESRL